MPDAFKYTDDDKTSEPTQIKDRKHMQYAPSTAPDMPKRSSKYSQDASQSQQNKEIDQKSANTISSNFSSTAQIDQKNTAADLGKASGRTDPGLTVSRQEVPGQAGEKQLEHASAHAQERSGNTHVNPLFLPDVKKPEKSDATTATATVFVGESASTTHETADYTSDYGNDSNLESSNDGYESAGTTDDVNNPGKIRVSRQLYGSQKSARALRAVDANRPREYACMCVFVCMFLCVLL
jgi:hypothetical protein